MRAGKHVLQYLHDETDAAWAITPVNPAGVASAFPVVDRAGAAIGYLTLVVEGDARRFEPLGAAAAVALGHLASVDARAARAADAPRRAPSLEDELSHGRILAYFQPIVELRTGHVVAIEALARWQTADGVLGPEAFLASFDHGELMLALFDRMLESALDVLADHKHRMPELSAAVNFEFAHVPERGLADLVRSRLAEHGADPESLSLELSERLAYDLSTAAVAELRALGDLGVKLLLDDVSSSLDAVTRLPGVPIAGAKLDRRHVKQLTGAERDVVVVREMIARAAALGIEVIAEGVETQTQCDRLVRLGCHFGQGYLFAVPQPASSLAAVLDAPLAATW